MRICSFNLGANINDYQNLCSFAEPSFNISSENELQELQKKYLKVETLVSDQVLNNLDVICLQEVSDLNRPFFLSLKERNFQIFHAPIKYPDCAIAISPDTFSNVQNLSTQLDDGDFALIVATHTHSGKTIAFASMHVPGFSLDGPISPDDTAIGDNHCHQVLDQIGKVHYVAFTIIGADMNANPEKYSARFAPFHNHQFTTYRTQAPTNVFPKSPSYKERELDFFFFKTLKKSGFISRLTSKHLFTLDPTPPLPFSPDSLFSDHIPIFAKIEQ